MSRILFIHPKKGLFQLTFCQGCSHLFECSSCDAKLVTYRSFGKTLELVCHQCQTYYSYPSICPKCGSSDVSSKYGGIDDLAEILETDFAKEVIRLDKISPKITSQEKEQTASLSNLDNQFKQKVYLTTRVFDPSINYQTFDKIIFIQAENLLADSDYLVQEEIMKNLAEILIRINENCQVIFDTQAPQLQLFADLLRLNKEHFAHYKPLDWFNNFLELETKNRQKYRFPPFVNLLLLTTQEKTKLQSIQLLEATKSYLQSMQKTELKDITLSEIYPARFLKRKNLYSHHLLIRYPKAYPQFNLLQSTVQNLASSYRLQVRLNPRHLF